MQSILHSGEDLEAELEEASKPWHAAFRRQCRKTTDADRIQELLKLATAVQTLDKTIRALSLPPIEAIGNLETNLEVEVALARLVQGKSAFAIPFGHKETKALLVGIQVAGVTPRSPKDWLDVATHLKHRLAIRPLVAQWNALSSDLALETIDEVSLEVAFKHLVGSSNQIMKIVRLASELDRPLLKLTQLVFGRDIAQTAAREINQAAALIAPHLDEHLRRAHMEETLSILNALHTLLNDSNGPIVDQIAYSTRW